MVQLHKQITQCDELDWLISIFTRAKAANKTCGLLCVPICDLNVDDKVSVYRNAIFFYRNENSRATDESCDRLTVNDGM